MASLIELLRRLPHTVMVGKDKPEDIQTRLQDGGSARFWIELETLTKSISKEVFTSGKSISFTVLRARNDVAAVEYVTQQLNWPLISMRGKEEQTVSSPSRNASDKTAKSQSSHTHSARGPGARANKENISSVGEDAEPREKRERVAEDTIPLREGSKRIKGHTSVVVQGHGEGVRCSARHQDNNNDSHDAGPASPALNSSVRAFFCVYMYVCANVNG